MVSSTCSLGKSLAATFRKVTLKFSAVLGFYGVCLQAKRLSEGLLTVMIVNVLCLPFPVQAEELMYFSKPFTSLTKERFFFSDCFSSSHCYFVIIVHLWRLSATLLFLCDSVKWWPLLMSLNELSPTMISTFLYFLYVASIYKKTSMSNCCPFGYCIGVVHTRVLWCVIFFIYSHSLGFFCLLFFFALRSHQNVIIFPESCSFLDTNSFF